MDDEELLKQIKHICSDYRPNEFEPDRPIQHCRINKKKLDAILALIKQDREVTKLAIAQNAMAIALNWIENDGRAKHLMQDMWDVRDISVLGHIEERFIEEAKGHFRLTTNSEVEHE